jgi:hypothetical protein
MLACRALIQHGNFGQVAVSNAGYVKSILGRKSHLADAEGQSTMFRG